jgi:DNA primase|tara:strand:- start:10543 stop:12402 length:1860 start_codon:yes stop_codon:yes gene_type:complete
MPRLAEGFINELKERIDLFDLVAPYVELKKSGSSWVGLSPFQQEKTPSFYVHPQKGFFKCFSSGETGDAISFVQKVENLDFQEALEFLSQRFGIPLRYESGGASQSFVKSIRAELHAVNEEAKEWFMKQLKRETNESKVAWQYWIEERKFSAQTAIEFGIGYAPTDEFALAEHLILQNFSKEIMSKSGLFREKLRQGKLVSSFQGRLMIPIHEKLGRICGFTARKLSATPEWGEKKAPKYINSPETPIFQKSQILFNLHLANKAIKDQKDFILVEGQLDAIRCFIEGFETVIAPQGTAFTESQADLLKKSNPRNVICLLDGDEAGRKAGLKYVPIFIGIGLNARFATIPAGSDPDQILLNEGKTRLNEILDESISMIEYVIKNLQLGEDISSPNISKNICDFIFTSLNKIDSLVIKESYLKELATLLGVSNEAVKQDFSKFEKQKLPKYRLQNPNPSNKETKDNSPVRLTNVEDDLLFILLHDDRIAGPLAYLIEPSWLNLQTTAGTILAKIFAEVNADGPMDFRRMEDFLENDQERKVFHHCLYKDHGDEEKDTFLQLANECLSVLFLRSSKEREEKIRAHLRAAEENATLMELRNELKEIRKLRNSPPTLSLSSPPN